MSTLNTKRGNFHPQNLNLANSMWVSAHCTGVLSDSNYFLKTLTFQRVAGSFTKEAWPSRAIANSNLTSSVFPPHPRRQMRGNQQHVEAEDCLSPYRRTHPASGKSSDASRKADPGTDAQRLGIRAARAGTHRSGELGNRRKCAIRSGQKVGHEDRPNDLRRAPIGRSYGRNAHCCAPPAQIRTWSLNHPAPTSGA